MATSGPCDVSRSASRGSSARRREVEEAVAEAEAAAAVASTRPVKRTPSRLHRQVIQAEVAVPEAGLGQIANSPVKLLSVKRTSTPDSEFFQEDLKRYPYTNNSVEYSWFLATCRQVSMENGGVSVEGSEGGTAVETLPQETQQQEQQQQQQQQQPSVVEDAPASDGLTTTSADAANETPIEALPTKTLVTSDQISVENTSSAEPGVENNVQQDGQEVLGGASQGEEGAVVEISTTSASESAPEVKEAPEPEPQEDQAPLPPPAEFQESAPVEEPQEKTEAPEAESAPVVEVVQVSSVQEVESAPPVVEAAAEQPREQEPQQQEQQEEPQQQEQQQPQEQEPQEQQQQEQPPEPAEVKEDNVVPLQREVVESSVTQTSTTTEEGSDTAATTVVEKSESVFATTVVDSGENFEQTEKTVKSETTTVSETAEGTIERVLESEKTTVIRTVQTSEGEAEPGQLIEGGTVRETQTFSSKGVEVIEFSSSGEPKVIEPGQEEKPEEKPEDKPEVIIAVQAEVPVVKRESRSRSRSKSPDKEDKKEEEEKVEGAEGKDVEAEKTEEVKGPKSKSPKKGFLGFFTRKTHKDKDKDKHKEKEAEKEKEKPEEEDKEKDKEEPEKETEKEKDKSRDSSPEKKSPGKKKKWSWKKGKKEKSQSPETKKKAAVVAAAAAPGEEEAKEGEEGKLDVQTPSDESKRATAESLPPPIVLAEIVLRTETVPDKPPRSPEVVEEQVTSAQAGGLQAAAPQQVEEFHPIETEAEVHGDSEPSSPFSDDMALQADHREIFHTEDRPQSLTLPRDAKSSRSSASPTAASPGPSTSQLLAPYSPNESFDNAVALSSRSSVDSGTGSDPSRAPGHFVVVAIDFGTTFSGYAFSFTRDADSIHMMRKWEGGDPGVINQKTPTCLLMDPEGKFHSFGFTARDFFHDLDPQESKKWLYFEKFKMTLHYSADLNKETMLKATNGKQVPALSVFSGALRFFKDHALQELSDTSSTKILNEDVRWVITVPAIWKAPAKQFMRQAAYRAGIASPDYPDQLLIALEPEAASIYVRKLRMHQLVPDTPQKYPLSPRRSATPEPMNQDMVADELRDDLPPQIAQAIVNHNSPTVYPFPTTETVGSEVDLPGTKYMVADCGGGTVDITVHEMEAKEGKLKELYKATGGPYGSVGVDIEFEKLLNSIFGSEFIDAFKAKRPAGWVDLMIAFESRKRATTPYKPNPLNVSLPFSFIDYHKKYRGCTVESVIRKYGDREIRWSTQGMLRLTPDAMRRLFLPTVERIRQSVGDVLNNPAAKDVKYIFLVGGFAESQVLQYEMRKEFGHLLKMIIPQDTSLAILKGAVLFGIDPTVVNVRRSRLVYGVGVLNRFVAGKHPKQKLVKRDNTEWCTDVFDKFVKIDQAVALGDTVLRSYTPAKPGQKSSVINIYCAERNDAEFITDPGVKKCGTLCLDLSEMQYQQNLPKRREIQTRMTFGGTEIRLSALDVATGKCVKAAIDFLNK